MTEEPYVATKFQNRVIHFHILDHHNPAFETLVKIMVRMEEWLKGDPENIIAVHCKV